MFAELGGWMDDVARGTLAYWKPSRLLYRVLELPFFGLLVWMLWPLGALQWVGLVAICSGIQLIGMYEQKHHDVLK